MCVERTRGKSPSVSKVSAFGRSPQIRGDGKEGREKPVDEDVEGESEKDDDDDDDAM